MHIRPEFYAFVQEVADPAPKVQHAAMIALTEVLSKLDVDGIAGKPSTEARLWVAVVR